MKISDFSLELDNYRVITNKQFPELTDLKPNIVNEGFLNFLDSATQFLLIVNDATRPTPTWKVLDIILPYLRQKKIKFLIATGAHHKQTKQELKFIFRHHYKTIKAQIYSHDAVKSPCHYYGCTGYGTKVYLNSMLKDISHIITIGSVEPHYFAGFSGGRKNILPGIAHFDTIEQNHRLSLNKNARILKLAKNPVNEDFKEALSLIDNEIYSIQLVCDNEANIFDIHSGTISNTFQKAVTTAKKIFTCSIKERYDIVISVVESPFDKNFYQALKGFENWKNAVKIGGIIIIVAKCEQGLGKNKFYHILKEYYQTNQKVDKQQIYDNYELGHHKAWRVIEFQKNRNIYFVSDLANQTLNLFNIRGFNSLQTAYDKAKQRCNKPQTLIVKNSAVLAPVLS